MDARTATAAVDGSGYGPDGERAPRRRPAAHGANAPDMAALLSAAALCNDAEPAAPHSSPEAWTALGDPTEAALLTGAGKLGLDPAI